MTKNQQQNYAKMPNKKTAPKTNKFKQKQYNCINPTCNRKFKSYKALSIHFDKSECSNSHQYNTQYIQNAVMDSKPASKPISQNKNKANIQFGIDLSYQNASSDESHNYLYPDTTDDDYTNDQTKSQLNASINTNKTHFGNSNIQTTSNLNNALYSKPSTPYTDAMYAETKLLKILNDANTPNYLFQQIMNWARESQ